PTEPETDFSYPEDSYCTISDNAFPNVSGEFTPGGVFSAENGLAIDPETGEIDFTNSEQGEYTVTYEVDADDVLCQTAGSSSFTLTVLRELYVDITQECDDNDLILTAEISGSSTNNNVSYVWKTDTGELIDETSNTLNVSNYLGQNNASLPMTFTVEIDYGDCFVTASHDVFNNPCGIIPRG